MTPFVIYQLKVAVGIMLFTCLYFVLFRKDTFYMANRIYLVLSMLISAILPLIEIPVFNPPQVQAVNELIGSVTVIPGVSASQIPEYKTPVLVILYRIMLVLFTLHLIYLICRLLLFAFKGGSVRLGRYRIITLSQKSQSFSFFNLIFISSPFNNEIAQNQVLQHEMVHARQWHSLDILIINIFKIFQWFNPFIYLAEKALQETHEYLADEVVLEQDGDSNGYRLLLLARVFGVQPGIVSLFNYSLIKNRMIMMTKQKSPLRNQWKYLAILPVIMLIIFGLSCTNKEDVISDITTNDQFPSPPPPPPPVSLDEANKGIDPSKISDSDTLFIAVDKHAAFQGGTLENFREWVQKNVQYPEKEVKEGVSGKVFAQFVVDSKGNVGSVKLLRGVSPAIDREVVRVISSSPAWVPGSYKGYTVKQKFVMPVVFQLEEKGNTGSAGVNTEEKAFVYVDEIAKFQGGSLETFREWVQRNLVYPEEAIKNGKYGRVTVQFTVNSAGKTTDVKILKSVDPLLDGETIRVIESSPAWTPAIHNDRQVSQQFVMPVIFQLQ